MISKQFTEDLEKIISATIKKEFADSMTNQTIDI
jgi:hypothetical protein